MPNYLTCELTLEAYCAEACHRQGAKYHRETHHQSSGILCLLRAIEPTCKAISIEVANHAASAITTRKAKSAEAWGSDRREQATTLLLLVGQHLISDCECCHKIPLFRNSRVKDRKRILSRFNSYHYSITTTTMASNSKISVAELDKHAKPDDCWIVVNGKVYDLTTFAPNHPGGPDSKTPATHTTKP